jgi:glycosyltransferase involved in cell wall biosynthesis
VTASPIRICHVIVGLGGGGAERMLERLAVAQTKSGGELAVSVVSLSDQGVLGESLAARGIVVHALGWRGLSDIPGMLLRLVSVLRSIRPDIVQTWMYHADLFGGLAARWAGVRQIVWGIRTTYLPENAPWSTKLARALCARLSFRIPTVIVCNAEAAKAWHIQLGYAPQKMWVIPNGFDTKRFSGSDYGVEELRKVWGAKSESLVVGMVGRDSPDKDPENFIAAMTEVLDRHPNVIAVLVGRGFVDDNRRISDLLSKSRLNDHFILAGETDDIVKSMAALDIFVLPSRTEAFPNVVAEAMAMRKVAVVTDVGDARSIVGDAGFVVPPGEPRMLAATIGAVIGLSAAERSALGEKARQRICSEFSMERAIDRFHHAYTSVLGRETTEVER